MPTGFVLMLSDSVPPDPIGEEVPALGAFFRAHGVTYVLTTKPVSGASYTYGSSRVALIVNGTNLLLAHGVLQRIHPYAGSPHLGPATYAHHHPPDPKRWIELKGFLVVDPPQDLGVLGWQRNGALLTSSTVPIGQGGQYFKAEHP